MSSSCFRANVGCDSLGAMRPIGTLAADLHVGPLPKNHLVKNDALARGRWPTPLAA
jgi:hypothetical protein